MCDYIRRGGGGIENADCISSYTGRISEKSAPKKLERALAQPFQSKVLDPFSAGAWGGRKAQVVNVAHVHHDVLSKALVRRQEGGRSAFDQQFDPCAAREDLRSTLGLSARANDQDIGRAYRRAMLSCHPDRMPHAEDRARQLTTLRTRWQS